MVPIDLDLEQLSPEEEHIRKESGVTHLCRMPDGMLCGIYRYTFTWAVVSELTSIGMGNRWCYHTQVQAVVALLKWSGEDGTEPEGWHRHPFSGRRVNKDTGEIYVVM